MKKKAFAGVAAFVLLSLVALCNPPLSHGATLARINFDFYSDTGGMVGTGYLQFGLSGFQFDTWYEIASLPDAEQNYFFVFPDRGFIISPSIDGWGICTLKIKKEGTAFVPSWTMFATHLMSPDNELLDISPNWGRWELCWPSDGYSGGTLTTSVWFDDPAPVPAPAAILLLGSGLAALAAFTRRFNES